MMAYWFQLKPNERLMIMVAGGLLLIFLIYSVLWEPYTDKVQRLEKNIVEQKELVQWLSQSAQEVKKLRAQSTGNGAGRRGGQSLLSLIDQTAKRANLGSSVKRVEPDGSDRVRVWLERAAFDDVARWLEQVEKDYALNIETAIVDNDDNPGRVSARIVFSDNE